jgi:hypothetical protein
VSGWTDETEEALSPRRSARNKIASKCFLLCNVKKPSKKDGKVFEFWNIEVEQMYLHPDYRLSGEPTATISDTGKLVVFELKPISGNGPWFVGPMG